MQNAANLDELAKEGERSVREAMKNPLFNEETIRQWSQSMQQWQPVVAKENARRRQRHAIGPAKLGRATPGNGRRAAKGRGHPQGIGKDGEAKPINIWTISRR
jgi:hypothetical protein